MSDSAAQTGTGATPQGKTVSSTGPEVKASQIGAPPENEATQDKTFTQADVDRIIASRVGPLQAKASEYDKLLESQKSETQKQAEALAALQAENQAFKAAQARRDAAKTAGLPAEAVDLVTGVTPEEIATSIQAVQALITSIQGPRAPQPDPAQGRTGTTPVSGDPLRNLLAARR